MTRNMRLAFWGAGALAVAAAVVFGPVFAGYVAAGAALTVILVLMVMRVCRAVGDWRLEHPWASRRRRGPASAADDEPRAA